MWNIRGVQSASSRCKETALPSPRHSVLKKCVYRERQSVPCHRCPLCDLWVGTPLREQDFGTWLLELFSEDPAPGKL